MEKKIENALTLSEFLSGKSSKSTELFNHFVSEFKKIGPVTVHPAATMIGIATARKRIAYVTQFGKTFLHVIFPFEHPHQDNMCFQKIAQVPGQKQFNHHFRMLSKDDLNGEVKEFMRQAFKGGN
jgi:hypothetical protein